MPEIVVLGSLNMDLLVRTARLPAPGQTVLGRDFTISPGGKGANQASAAALLGAQVGMIGRVGSDDYGDLLRGSLAASRIDSTHVTIDSRLPTGVAIITIDEGGQNTIVVAPGANASLLPEHMDEAKEMLKGARVLLAQLEVPLETVTLALELARAAHVTTILNPSPAQTLTDHLLALCDFVIPNETEASILAGIDVTDAESAALAAQALSKRSHGTVVVTLGERGALAWNGETLLPIPAFHVQPEDSTAAGDAFAGALALGIASRLDLAAALRLASAAGALTTTRLGAQPSLPTFRELEQFLAQHQIDNPAIPSGTT